MNGGGYDTNGTTQSPQLWIYSICYS